MDIIIVYIAQLIELRRTEMLKALVMGAFASVAGLMSALAASPADVQAVIEKLEPNGRGGKHLDYVVSLENREFDLLVYEGTLVRTKRDLTEIDRFFVSSGFEPIPRGRVFSLDVSDGQCRYFFVDKDSNGTLTHWGAVCLFDDKLQLAHAPQFFGPDRASAQKRYDAIIEIILRE